MPRLSIVALGTFLFAFPTVALEQPSAPESYPNGTAGLVPPINAVGPDNIVVQPKFGGAILGFSIDQSGTEGLLSEYKTLNDGNFFVATETFSQKTGKIVKVLAKENDTQDNYVTLGVFGHVGVDEYYQAGVNSFPLLNPLKNNAFNETWTPPVLQDYSLWSVAGVYNTNNVAVLTYQSCCDGAPSIFASNIATNTFGPQVMISDPVFCFCTSPVMAYDAKTNQAVMASSYGPRANPVLALADLTSSKLTEFTGVGFSYVQGIAIDASKGIAVTTTLGDALDPSGLQVYDVKKETGFEVTLPCSGEGSEYDAGATVAFDPVNQVFLVQQPNTTGCNGGSNLYVYDEAGNLKETLTGFQQLPVNPTPVAVNPKTRTGFIFADRFATALQGFAY